MTEWVQPCLHTLPEGIAVFLLYWISPPLIQYPSFPLTQANNQSPSSTRIRVPYSMQRMTSYDDPVCVQSPNIRLLASRGSLVPSRRFQQKQSAATTTSTVKLGSGTTSLPALAAESVISHDSATAVGATARDSTQQSARPPSPELSLQGKVVILVRSDGHGLDTTMAEGLVRPGATVHCVESQHESQGEAEQVQQQQRTQMSLGGKLHRHQVDLRNTHALRQKIAEIAAMDARLDGVVVGTVAEGTKYVLELIQEVAKQMLRLKTPGSIVMAACTSTTAVDTDIASPTYISSTTDMGQLTKSLATEWARYGIRINSLRPGKLAQPL